MKHIAEIIAATGLLLLMVCSKPHAPAALMPQPPASTIDVPTAAMHEAVPPAVVSSDLSKPITADTQTTGEAEQPSRSALPLPVVETTDGPTPLTEAQFADMQKWLRDGKPLQEWVNNHPDPALRSQSNSPPAHDPLPAPARAPAALSGRFELRTVKTGFRTYEQRWVWVSYQPQAYQPQSVGRTSYGQQFRNCASGNCGGS